MTHYQLIESNKRKSLLVTLIFIIFIISATYFMSYSLGYGLNVVGVALIFSGMMSFASYWYSDKIILGISGAHEAKRSEYFDFYTIAENLAMSQKMPKPKLYVMNDTALNAFATGRDPDHAVICVTTGLLQTLNRAELEGVIAHELSHVANYDIRLMSVVTILVGFIALLSDWMLRISFRGKKSDDNNAGQIGIIIFIVGILLTLLSPLIAKLIQLAISRKREFLADASGVGMTKNPSGLIKALEKISNDKEPLEAANKATAHLYISNPLKNIHSSAGLFTSMFMTHPPVEQRLKALRSLSN